MANRFLDPEGLARVGNMELVARGVVEGFLTGRHRSPFHGFSAEYLDHRAYSPGDEIRALDWKVLAKTNKYYIKLFHDETNLRATILLDCSKSMAFRRDGISKLEWGSYLAAALTHLLLRQNDAVGLMLFDTTIRESIPPKARPTQFRRVLDMLEGITPGGETRVGAVLHQVAERLHRRGLVILISDLIDDPAEIASGLQHYRHDGHEVVVVQVLDDAELTFPFDQLTRFQDMEGAGRVTVNPKGLRDKYLARMQQFLDRVKADCFERGVSYNLASTKSPYDVFLAAYLEKRSRMG